MPTSYSEIPMDQGQSPCKASEVCHSFSGIGNYHKLVAYMYACTITISAVAKIL